MENVAIIESIGAYLKSIRRKKKLTLEQISEATCIKIRLLNDIENDNFSNLGGLGYAKAMIINYANQLEADEEKILELFNEKFDQKPIHVSRVRSIQPKKIVIPQNFFALILLLVVIVILTSLVFYLYKNDIITWPPFTKLDNTVKVKQTAIISDSTSTLEKLRQKIVPEEPSSINADALQDTTDYLNELMFKDKESPLNYED